MQCLPSRAWQLICLSVCLSVSLDCVLWLSRTMTGIDELGEL